MVGRAAVESSGQVERLDCREGRRMRGGGGYAKCQRMSAM